MMCSAQIVLVINPSNLRCVYKKILEKFELIFFFLGSLARV